MHIYIWRKGARVAAADCFFNDMSGIYTGNLYDVNGAIIGDYYTTCSADIERRFPGIFK